MQALRRRAQKLRFGRVCSKAVDKRPDKGSLRPEARIQAEIVHIRPCTLDAACLIGFRCGRGGRTMHENSIPPTHKPHPRA